MTGEQGHPENPKGENQGRGSLRMDSIASTYFVMAVNLGALMTLRSLGVFAVAMERRGMLDVRSKRMIE